MEWEKTVIVQRRISMHDPTNQLHSSECMIDGTECYDNWVWAIDLYLFGLELHERSEWRPTAPDMHCSFPDTTLSEYITSPYICNYFVYNYTWQQNSHTLWLHTKHQTTALVLTKHRFIRTKLVTNPTSCPVFQLIVYPNIKITMSYYHTSLWGYCQAAKKEHKLSVKINCM